MSKGGKPSTTKESKVGGSIKTIADSCKSPTGSLPSISMETGGGVSDGEESQRKRRRNELISPEKPIEAQRGNQPKKKKLREKMIDLHEEVNKVARNLAKLVRENQNTKVEIKEGIRALCSIANQLVSNEVRQCAQEMSPEAQPGPREPYVTEEKIYLTKPVEDLREEVKSLTGKVEAILAIMAKQGGEGKRTVVETDNIGGGGEKEWSKVVAAGGNKRKERETESKTPASNTTAEKKQVDKTAAKPGAEGGKAGKNKPTKVMVEVKGTTYSAMLGKLRRGLEAGAEAGEVSTARRSLAGNVVLELKKGVNGESIAKKINTIVEGSKAVVTRGSRMVAEVKFLEEETKEEEIVEALERESGEGGGFKVLWIRNYGGDLRIALVEGPRNEINKLIEKGRVKIGWTSCRVGAKPERPEPCLKCRGFGHKAAQCTGKDRREECRRCGHKGHVAKSCDAAPKCGPCEDKGVEADHMTGDRECTAYREAVQTVRTMKGDQVKAASKA